MNDYEKALALTKAYGQEHLLAFYSTLGEEDKQALLRQIHGIDFALVQALYRKVAEGRLPETGEITPISCIEKSMLSGQSIKHYEKTGQKIMESGGFAAVTMAGGQGTRLGYDGPKGTFDIGLPSHWSLFQIQCERLKKQSRACGRAIPWYIMTSRENDHETKQFFEVNRYFGYDKNAITFFTQCMLPMVHTDGRIVLEKPGKIKEGADGHGGIFRAMRLSGVLDDMKQRGIQWIFVGGIDNVLTRLCDPFFVGYVKESGCLLGGKSLLKRDAAEKVGVFCRRAGKPCVVEYTEISSEMTEWRDAAGRFIYGDAHILCNLFHISVFDMMGEKGLPYHAARKQTISVMPENGGAHGGTHTAYKFEAFIFDAFGYFDDMALLRVVREEEFAPVKNRTGEDSPETAQALYTALKDPI